MKNGKKIVFVILLMWLCITAYLMSQLLYRLHGNHNNVVQIYAPGLLNNNINQRCGSVTCIITNDENQSHFSDAIIYPIFHISNPLSFQPERFHSNQLMVLHSMESTVNYPHLNDLNFLNKFDIVCDLSLGSECFLSYISDVVHAIMWPPAAKIYDVPVAMFVSNCNPKSERNAIIEKLMKYVRIDSYGKCFHNKDVPQQYQEQHPRDQKISVLKHYKFTIAIENTIAENYVTEKFFDPLIVGSVPIYLGAPNIDQFAPDTNSYIDINGFDSIETLGVHINMLAGSDEQYRKLLEWKHKGGNEQFQQFLRRANQTNTCAMCNSVYNKKKI